MSENEKKRIIIGSRESRLAVIQSEMVKEYIEKNCPGLTAELLTMKTTGDIILDRTLDQVGGKGLFVKELDKALLEGRSDLSVHSLKDLPMEVPEELPLVAYSVREDPRDVLVLPEGASEPDFSKPIGCAGPRRQLQLKTLFPDCQVKAIRGNVLTRLRKLDDGEYGALVLAAAGLKRLGLENRISRYFDPEEMIPAAGQGILAVQGRKGQDYGYLAGFEDHASALAARAERAFVRELDGGCSSPIAAHGMVKDGKMTLLGLYFDETSGRYRRGRITGDAEKPEELGQRLARQLKASLTGDNAADPQHQGGKVWLVGAGPGDLGLFTMKGMEVLKQADVVVYDSLVGAGVLSCIPETAETINVGKRASHHTMPQEQINQVLVEQAKRGLKVVRLKGGDPFLFGRGGEELELLTAEGIPYEVVPGVTAAISVPAYNGIPVTHRDFCSSVHIITGHKRAGQPYDIDFDALVRTKGTLVFLMGVAALPDICGGLLAAGMEPDTPAAILQQGTTAGQKRIVATLSTLEREVALQGVETPAIIVVGRVCGLADQFGWYEKLPLFGCRVVVTRPKNRKSTMAENLRKLGAEVVELPSIQTRPKQNQNSLHEVLQEIEKYQWLVFTSPYGVEVFFDELLKQRIDVRRLRDVRIAAIGASTKKEVERRGLLVDLMPKTYHGRALGEELYKACEDGDGILLARAEIGSRDVIEALRKDGEKNLRIKDVAIYETGYAAQEAVDISKLLEGGKISCVTFTSASTVKGFAAAAAGADMARIKAVCIGEQTQAAAEELGMKTWVSKEATMESLTRLIIELKEKQVI